MTRETQTDGPWTVFQALGLPINTTYPYCFSHNQMGSIGNKYANAVGTSMPKCSKLGATDL
jgi:hypothetical protein